MSSARIVASGHRCEDRIDPETGEAVPHCFRCTCAHCYVAKAAKRAEVFVPAPPETEIDDPDYGL